MEEELNSILNRFYDQNVAMSRADKQEAAAQVYGFIHKILSWVNKVDGRFMIEPFKTGSYYQGLKVEAPDEFDFGVKLNYNQCLVWGDTLRNRYYELDDPNVPDPVKGKREDINIIQKRTPLPPPPIGFTFVPNPTEWTTSSDRNGTTLDFDDDLIPFLVKTRLKNLVERAVTKLNIGNKVRVMKFMSGPATTLVINEAEQTEKTVDLSAMIITNLPFPPCMQWPRAGTQWPDPVKVQKVKAAGINFVAKRNLYWTIDTAVCEKELLAEIDKDGGCRKKSQRILKRLKEEWQKDVKSVLSSYCLKNALYWQCEDYPYSFQWSRDKLSERVMGMTRWLGVHLLTRRVPWYFCPDVDILRLEEGDERHLDEIIWRMRHFLSDPFTFIERLLKK